MNSRLLRLIVLSLVSTQLFAHSTSTRMNVYLDSIRNQPMLLQSFLYAMPKGGDLHNHEGGASMTEYLLSYAAKDNFCIDPITYTVYSSTSCPSNDLLNNFKKNAKNHDALVDAWSMRDFDYHQSIGHDHFFATFGKFSEIANLHRGDILAEVMQRAALQNESYLEIMVTADGNESGQLGEKLGWNNDFEVMRKKLLANGITKIVADISGNLNQDQQTMANKLSCHTKAAQPGCGVKVKYLYQVLREQKPEMVFAQLLAGFEAASKDSRIVGINMVQPEDGIISMRDYTLHMQMVAYLRSLYPNVHVSLHAGELVSGLVPPEGLRYHIHDAVYVANADRIGHGVDIMQENQASTLLTTMAKKHILVEINLGSNADILGIKGKNHPLSTYLQYGVPVALSTDDEGISRENLTQQYVRALKTYPFSYDELKNVVRNSISYGFVAGDNLWMDTQYHQLNSACQKDTPGSEHPSHACLAFLDNSEKATLQWDLEKRFKEFEKHY